MSKNWVLRIEHHSGYRYAAPVLASYNEVRMTPLTTDRQVAVSSRIEIEPRARSFRYLDYWATVVDVFDLHRPHTDLTITATSVVEAAPAPAVPDGVSWADLTSDRVVDRYAEFLAPTSFVPVAPELGAMAAELAAGRSPAEAVEAAAAFVAAHLTYTPGATGVSTSALDAFSAGHGVCQDYAHVTLALLRAMGIPGRYTSGYLHTQRDARPGDSVAGESHAWVEAFVGRWWGFDPTNGGPAGERHAAVGWGRDYADVPPLKGIYSAGEAPGDLSVAVRVTRLA